MISGLRGLRASLGFGWLRWAVSGRKTRWLPLRLTVHIVLMLLVAAGFSLVVWTWLGAPDLSGPYTSKQRLEVAKLVLAVTAGLGGIVALVVAYRRQRLSESTEAREDTRAFSERFTAASEQLSSERVANRLAGVYAMAHLADDWDTGRQTCINVLCAYMRMPYEPSEELPTKATDEQRASQEEGHVRAAIMDTIGERLAAEPVDGKTWHGHIFDFTGATIHSGRLQNVKVTGGVLNFSRATFTQGRTSFRGAIFSGGTVDFWGADFTSGTVSFSHAEFSGGSIGFVRAHFRADVRFAATMFNGATVSFHNAQFNGGTVNFGSAQFMEGGVGFEAADFWDADVDFRQAVFGGGEVDMSAVGAWSVPPRFDEFPSGTPTGLILPTSPGQDGV